MQFIATYLHTAHICQCTISSLFITMTTRMPWIGSFHNNFTFSKLPIYLYVYEILNTALLPSSLYPSNLHDAVVHLNLKTLTSNLPTFDQRRHSCMDIGTNRTFFINPSIIFRNGHLNENHGRHDIHDFSRH